MMLATKQQHHLLRVISILSLVLILLTSALYIIHPWILTQVAMFMDVHEPPQAADIIVPLYRGSSDAVLSDAAKLYHQGYAPRVVLVRLQPDRLQSLGLLPHYHDISRRFLESASIPSQVITTMHQKVSTTVELAQALSQTANPDNIKRAILVAPAPLSRVIRYDLDQGLNHSDMKLSLYTAYEQQFGQHIWWKHRLGWVTYFDAYYLWMLRLFRN